jgi:hypothetical protein
MELIVNKTIDIQHNMIAVQSNIQDKLKKWDLVVIESNVLHAKKDIAQINKDKKSFSDYCKKFLYEIEVPIKEFKAKQKEIESLYDDAILRLSSQVQKFETIKLEDIAIKIISYKNNMCEEKGIDNKLVSVENLILLSSVNEKGSISKKTIDCISNKIIIVETQILKHKVDIQEKYLKDEKIRLDEIQAERERVETKSIDAIQKGRDIAETKRLNDIEISKNKYNKIVADGVGIKYDSELDTNNNSNSKTDFKVIVMFSINAPSQIPQNAVENKVFNRLTELGLKDFKLI